MLADPRVVTLTIDEHEIGANDSQTILEVARENNLFIPTLCFMEGLSAVGACRLCIVEVEGARRPVPACATRVTEGMVVRTHSEQLHKYRRLVLEMLFSEGNHVCSVCVSNGHCELQSMARRLGMDHLTVPYRYPKRSVDASHPRFTADQNRCILCARCVRVCDEIEGAHTWDIMGRGIDSQIVTDLCQPWGESQTCTSCGKCVHICPTGALVEKGPSVAEMVKKRQFLPYLSSMREAKNE
jgi:bidirectional [NiFe] hydrogenase diaphorase subunit